MPAALQRAREDLSAGRPWKARERLRSYVNAFPTDEEALELLGEVRYTMGDLPAAGSAWVLCQRDDERTGVVALGVFAVIGLAVTVVWLVA